MSGLSAAPRGRFLVLEGPDGAGTTTQAGRLADQLEPRLGHRPHITAEPSGLPVGRLIRERLKGREEGGQEGELRWPSLALLFAADRLDHYRLEIAPLLDDGRWVISDRYRLSSLVYQSLHVDTAWVRTLNERAPAPDACFLLALPLDVALARIAARAGTEEIYDGRALQERVHGLYRTLGEAEGAIEVDAGAPVDDVTAALLRELDERGWL